jgi:hypothetical protein
MNWTGITDAVSCVLALVLVIRLFTLGLHEKYRVFVIFFVYDILSTILLFAETYIPNNLDYRYVWLFLQGIVWVFWLWLVYALLQAILANFPGLLRLSRRVLNIIFPVAILISAIGANVEISASGAATQKEFIVRVDIITLVITRVVATVALLTLLLMLLFILWFPVKMPRNLAALSIGFVLFFASKTVILLLHVFVSPGVGGLVNFGGAGVLAICYLFWAVTLNREGEMVPVVLGHRWRAGHQAQLLTELETINSQLLRAARR